MINNNGTLLGLKAPPSEAQIATIDLLKELLAEALEGKVEGVGIVALMQGGWATVMTATKPGDLNLGCDDLKRKILDAVVSGKAAAPASKIQRVR